MNSVATNLESTESEIIFGGKVVKVLNLDQQSAEDLFKRVKEETQAKVAWCFLGGEFHLIHLGGPESRKRVRETVSSLSPSKNQTMTKTVNAENRINGYLI